MLSIPALERLSQRHKILGRFHARRRVEVVANVDAKRAHRSAVAEAKTDRVCVIARELVEINVAVDVAAVVKNDAAQTAFQWNGKAHFRIHDGEHMSADRHADQRAGGSIGGVTAKNKPPPRGPGPFGGSAPRIGGSAAETRAPKHEDVPSHR